MLRSKNLIFSLAAVLWLAFIYALSSIPGQYLGPDTLTMYLVQKIGHVTLFGVLSVLLFSVVRGINAMKRAPWLIFPLSFMLTVICAVADEYHQAFTPCRHPSVVDVAIDAFGAALFLGCACLFVNKRTVFTRLLPREGA
jgi:VanZ like family